MSASSEVVNLSVFCASTGEGAKQLVRNTVTRWKDEVIGVIAVIGRFGSKGLQGFTSTSLPGPVERFISRRASVPVTT